MNREIAPDTIAPPAANYAHAVLSEGMTRWLHTAGVVATAPDGSVPEVVGDQAAVIWSNIGAILAAAGMSAVDIVSVTTYVVAGQPLAAVMQARDGFLGGRRVASTLVTVPALARPEWLVEVAVIAAGP